MRKMFVKLLSFEDSCDTTLFVRSIYQQKSCQSCSCLQWLLAFYLCCFRFLITHFRPERKKRAGSEGNFPLKCLLCWSSNVICPVDAGQHFSFGCFSCSFSGLPFLNTWNSVIARFLPSSWSHSLCYTLDLVFILVSD